MSEYEDTIREFEQLRRTMLEDLEYLNKLLIEDPLNECLIRVSIRTLFSFIETTCYIWKTIAYLKDKRDIALGRRGDSSLSDGEISIILEQAYYVEENGEIKVRQIHVEPKKNLQFALKVFAKTHGFEYEHIFNKNGWNAYCEGLKIRNRLTHPKSDADLFITEEEHEISHEVFEWFFGIVINLGTDKFAIN